MPALSKGYSDTMSKPAFIQISGNNLDFKVHPQRDAALDEIHARPFHRLEAPRRILHFAFQVNREEAKRDKDAVAALCERHMYLAPAPNTAYHRVMRPDYNLRWEQHSEFTTQSWDFPIQTLKDLKQLDHPPLPLEDFWQPGPLLVALDIMVMSAKWAKGIETRFDETSLARSRTDDGTAEALTDFKRDAKGFTRIVVIDHGMNAMQAGSLVQRLVEIETYRTLTLLGLPEARRISGDVQRIETSLAGLIDRSRNAAGIEDNRKLLQELTSLTADLETIASSVSYRFAASEAYDDIVFQRLAILDEQQVGANTTWQDFLARRMAPARRTLTSMQNRLQDLSRKLTRATHLLRTRVDVEQEQQNQELLKSMNERTRLQLRLQQTVEGLSVAAITYYLVGLSYYALQGAVKLGWVTDASIITAMLVPVILLVVWLLMRRVKKRLED
jgi:uncharacterized membrane-anchored protein